MPNPVLTKLSERPAVRSAPAPSPDHLQRMYDQPSYNLPATTPPGQYPPFGKGYGGGDGGGVTRYMTLDDVVVRTAAMLGVIFVTGALTWSLGPTSSGAGGLVGLGLIGGLGLGLYMAFTMRANAVTALLYSAFEGLLLGGVSRAFNDRYPGIVIQALTGTVLVAAGMLVVYRSGAIRVTPRFTRVVIGATIGAVGLMVVNLVASIFVSGGLGLRDAVTRPGHRFQRAVHRHRRLQPGARLRHDRSEHQARGRREVRLVRLVRAHGHPDLALHRTAADDRLPAGLAMAAVPGEGGWKAVLDVVEPRLAAALTALSAAGFRAAEYYHPSERHGPGRAPAGRVRIGVEHPMTAFTGAEERRLAAAFEALLAASPLAVTDVDRVGTDTWKAGGDPAAGVREPRRPRPKAQAGAATAD